MRITAMAERLHVLPYSGGLLEQPPGALFKMEAILAAHSKVASAGQGREEAEERLDARMKSGEA
jgi:hypothetical protein